MYTMKRSLRYTNGGKYHIPYRVEHRIYCSKWGDVEVTHDLIMKCGFIINEDDIDSKDDPGEEKICDKCTRGH